MSLIELFAVGGFWFFVVCAVELCWLLGSTSYENNIATTVSLVVFGFFLQLAGVDVVGTVLTSPLHIALALVLWLVIGIGYSFIKWRRLLSVYVKQYDYFFGKFIASKGLPEGTTELGTQALKKEWVSYVDGNHYNFNPWAKGPSYGSSYHNKEIGPIYEEPDAGKHKYHIVHWIAYWPLNAPVTTVVFLCEDVFKEFANWAYYYLGDMYQAVARSVFRSRNVNANLPEEVVAKKSRKK